MSLWRTLSFAVAVGLALVSYWWSEKNGEPTRCPRCGVLLLGEPPHAEGCPA